MNIDVSDIPKISEIDFVKYEKYFCSYRYRITPTAHPDKCPEEVDTDDDADVVTSVSDVTATSLSRSAMDLRMGVASFCKAFPWHFVVDRRLEMVQLGAGFMQLFAHDLQTLGTSVATYFEFNRPRGIALCFNEIVKRANTPFILTIRWRDSKAEKRLAEVRKYPALSLNYVMFATLLIAHSQSRFISKRSFLREVRMSVYLFPVNNL
jgi:hypothetical protein